MFGLFNQPMTFAEENTPQPRGLLSGFLDDPRKMAGLAAFGQALAQAGAPSRTGNHWGLALSNAIGGAQQGMSEFEQREMQRQMQRAQMGKAQEDLRKQKTINDMIAGALSGQSPQGAQGAAQPATNDAAPQRGNSMMSLLPMMALASGDNKAAYDMLLKNAEGIKKDAGAFYVNPVTGAREFVPDVKTGLNIDPRTNNVSQLPGFSAANAGIKGAETAATEGAKAGLDFVQVPQSDGTTRMMTRADAEKQLGSAPQGANIPGLPQGIAEELTRAGIGFTADDKGNFKIVRGVSPQQSEAMAQGGARLGVSANPVVMEANKGLNEDFIKRQMPDVYSKGSAAGDMLNHVKVARDSLANIGPQGWGTEGKGIAANVLVGLGIAPENAKMFASNVQRFNQAGATRLWTVLGDQKGPQTEGDAERAKLTFARLNNTKDANAYILDLAEAVALRDKMRADFYRQALPIAQQRGDLQEIDREWQKRAPSIFSLGGMTQWVQ